MKKVILVLSALCLLSGFTSAKTPRFVNLEFFGAYNLAGFSFDGRFSESSRFGYRVGLGYGFGYSRVSGMYSSRSNEISMPVNVYHLFGKRKHYFELGIGAVPYYIWHNRVLVGYDGIPAQYSSEEFNCYGFIQPAYRFEGSNILLSAGIMMAFGIGICPEFTVGYRL